MENPIVFKTDCQEERERQDFEIFTEYNQLMKVDGQSKTKVNEHLMKKYGVHSVATIYSIRRRVQERLARKGATA